MIGRRTPSPPDQTVEESAGLQSFDDFELRLGDVMRGERATAGKSLLDVQRELKIKASYIAAIENADPSAFETPGFVAGYVRSYARYLGIDAEWAFAQFCKEGNFRVTHGLGNMPGTRSRARKPDGAVRSTVSNDPFENPNTPFTPHAESLLSRIEPGALGSITVLALLVAGIGYGGWFMLQQVQRVDMTPVDQTPGVVAEVDPLAPSDGAAGTQTAGLEPPPADTLDRLYRPQALDVPVLTARDGPIATLDPRTIGTLQNVEPVADTSPTTVTQLAPAPPGNPAAGPDTGPDTGPVKVVEDGPQTVVMFAVRPSWVRVRSADGTVLFEKILDAGEQYELPQTEATPSLRAGNAGSVYFLVGGQTYGPAGQGASVVKNVALGPADLTGTFDIADLEADRDLAKVVASLEGVNLR